jgi:hypothetical protein
MEQVWNHFAQYGFNQYFHNNSDTDKFYFCNEKKIEDAEKILVIFFDTERGDDLCGKTLLPAGD